MTLETKDLICSGAFRVTERLSHDLIAKALFVGERVADGTIVSVAYVAACAVPLERLRARFCYVVPGVSEVLCLDTLDRPSAPPYAPEVVLVEARPKGGSLSEMQVPLPAATAARLASGVCRIALDARSKGVVLEGLAPAVVFGEGRLSDWHLTGIAPRARLFLGVRQNVRTLDGHWSSLDNPQDIYVAPEEVVNPDPDATNTYLIGLLLAYALEGRHPFARKDGECSQFELMSMDRPLPFTAPPAFAGLLERVLVADPLRRMKLDDLATELEDLCR